MILKSHHLILPKSPELRLFYESLGAWSKLENGALLVWLKWTIDVLCLLCAGATCKRHAIPRPYLRPLWGAEETGAGLDGVHPQCQNTEQQEAVGCAFYQPHVWGSKWDSVLIKKKLDTQRDFGIVLHNFKLGKLTTAGQGFHKGHYLKVLFSAWRYSTGRGCCINQCKAGQFWACFSKWMTVDYRVQQF